MSNPMHKHNEVIFAVSTCRLVYRDVNTGVRKTLPAGSELVVVVKIANRVNYIATSPLDSGFELAVAPACFKEAKEK